MTSGFLSAEQLRRLRADVLGLASAAEAARGIGMTPHTLGRYERGELPVDQRTVMAIAWLGCHGPLRQASAEIASIRRADAFTDRRAAVESLAARLYADSVAGRRAPGWTAIGRAARQSWRTAAEAMLRE